MLLRTRTTCAHVDLLQTGQQQPGSGQYRGRDGGAPGGTSLVAARIATVQHVTDALRDLLGVVTVEVDYRTPVDAVRSAG